MSTWQRFGIALFYTIALMLGGLIYNRVFSDALLPLVDPSGTFSTPVIWLDRLVPVILVVLLLAAWAWVIAGAIQQERTIDARRRVR